MATSSSSRKPLKRVFDLCDSPASSTPPRPPNKRQHVDPSDSPTNPFGLFTVTNPRSLPRMSHTDEHLVLRFQLASRNNVFRIAYAPMNYSFWHLSQLVQFLFGWKDVRYVRTRSSKRVRREVQHLALVQKDVTFFNNSTRVGLVKAGRTVAKVVAQLPDKKSSKRYEDSRLELEDGFTLQHVWPKGTEYNRAVVYEYGVNTHDKETVYITLHREIQEKARNRDGYSNTPLVIQGAGLPNDDEDDDDFALDLQQWNEVDAFEDFIASQDEESLSRDTQTECSSVDVSRRFEEEQERLVQTLKAPLPLNVQRDPLELKKLKGRVSTSSKDKQPQQPSQPSEKQPYDPDPFGDEAEI